VPGREEELVAIVVLDVEPGGANLPRGGDTGSTGHVDLRHQLAGKLLDLYGGATLRGDRLNPRLVGGGDAFVDVDRHLVGTGVDAP